MTAKDWLMIILKTCVVITVMTMVVVVIVMILAVVEVMVVAVGGRGGRRSDGGGGCRRACHYGRSLIHLLRLFTRGPGYTEWRPRTDTIERDVS